MKNDALARTTLWYYVPVHNRHRKTLEAIFATPMRAQIRWSDVEALFLHLGRVIEGRGSRIHVEINGVSAAFHRPHPSPMIRRPTIGDVKQLLIDAGVAP